jgi:hypothetical protein
MIYRPTLTTTTAPEILATIQAIQAAEQRTRASVVQELLTLGLKARGKALAGVVRRSGARHVHARDSVGVKS